MGTFLTSRIITCELERSKPSLDREGYPWLSTLGMTGTGLPQPCLGWGQDEVAELPAQGSHSSSFSCFSGRATQPVWTRPMLESSPCFCDSRITCPCALAPPALSVPSQSHFLASFLPAFTLPSIRPGQGGPLLLPPCAAGPGSTQRQLAPHTQN